MPVLGRVDTQTVENMEKYGGDFVKALANCIRRADPINYRKLKDTFAEYFQTYHPCQWVKKQAQEKKE